MKLKSRDNMFNVLVHKHIKVYKKMLGKRYEQVQNTALHRVYKLTFLQFENEIKRKQQNPENAY